MSSPVPIRNLYHLLAYAWDQFQFVSKVPTGEDAGPDGTALLTRVLIGGCDRLIRRGLDRAYRTEDEITGRVRGRILVDMTLRRYLLQVGMAHCEFDELSHDSLPNRLLKATLRQLRTSANVPRELRPEVDRLFRLLDGAQVRDERLSRASFRQVQLHRNNAFYSFLLHVCELLNEGRFPDEHGTAGPFATILRDELRMGKLFEKFLLNFFRREQSTFTAHSEAIQWDVQEGEARALALLPGMQTDVIMRSPEMTLVIDAKFYKETLQSHRGKDSVHSNHLYQLFSYLKNLEAREGPDATAAGILIYPTVQRELSLSYRLSGHAVGVETVDLANSWPAIHSRLLEIVTRVVASATGLRKVAPAQSVRPAASRQ
jgi:5-methylcytosine-specific restriction enzyme subunit McrC